ncbi:MAG TPA: SNF2-related protein [Polyangiaceae bacterium]|nr:SNF2-related protein [Polyangiaceae bacterium]
MQRANGPAGPPTTGGAGPAVPGGGGGGSGGSGGGGGKTSPIADTLSTLSDRGLRRLLGARTFLRGLEYARRRVVEEVAVRETVAEGRVRGSDSEPYLVKVLLTPEGIKSQCSCPVFVKSQQHCKHVAALLISVRDQARGASPRPQPPPAPSGGGGGGGGGGEKAPPAASVSGSAGPNAAGGKASRRERRRARLLALQQGSPGGHGHHNHERHAPAHGPHASHAAIPAAAQVAPDGVARTTGIGAWLPQSQPVPRPIEFRVLVRPGGLTVTALDPEARVPMLPSVALTWQALAPTPDRDALRVLARFESGNPRHPAVDIRGEDVSELLPYLANRRVLLEPTLMQLRFGEEPLRPRFDLELVGSDTIVAKASFERPSDRRKFSLANGGWFEGWPGWHVDIAEGIARPIDRRVSPAALRRLQKNPTIAEPMGELIPLIMDGLPKVALEMGAELPALDQIADVVDLEPTFRMQAGGSLVEARVTLTAVYGDTEVQVRADGISPPVIIKPPEGGQKRFRCIRCDIPAQQQAAERLAALGLSADETGQSFVAQGDRAIKFWSEGLGSLPDEWDLFVPEDLVDTQVRPTPLRARAFTDSGVDWLSLKLSFESEGIAVGRDELVRCLAEGRKYVRLEDGSYATLDPAQVRSILDREIELLTAAGKTGRIPLSQAGRLQELLGQIEDKHVSPKTAGLFKKLAGIDSIEAVKKPRALKATLRPYQEAGLSWLRFIHDLRSGGVLADDMGLGKTLQTIALLCSVKQDEKQLRSLIVAPTSVVYNWSREIERFAPTLKTTIWHGADRHEQKDALEEAEVVITSYPLLRRDEELLSGIDFDYVILDEAQHIKNPLSATAAAAKKLKAGRRLALTGTPIENRLSEFWSIFDFVSPGLLGSLEKFEERYARPIDAGDAKTAARLRAAVHAFILRRTKLEVEKDLPEKIEMDQVCEMTPEQRGVYLSVLREVRAHVLGEVEKNGLAKSQLHILAGLTRLRQAACDPRLLGLPKPFTDEDSGKLQALVELLEQCLSGGHKVLVFSQFTSMLALVREALEKEGITYEYLDGSTKDRAERVDRFQNDASVGVFLISLKAGGTGLNLTAADTVVHYDPWWNPAVEEQASARAHRIGQSKVVNVYRLVSQGTIEEKILQLKQKKRDLVATVLSEDAGGAKKLTKTDLEELFRLD